MVLVHQHAYVEGRHNLDVAIIANEALDSRLKSSNSKVVCKLDIKKTYDYVNWDFLLTG